MSDPVTNVEIEDVLSSIRRLVAEGDKARRPKPEPTPEKPQPPERFVLTPALRVTRPRVDSEPVAEDTTDAGADPVVDDTPMAFVSSDPVPANDRTPIDPAPDNDAADNGAPVEIAFDRAKLEQSDMPFDRASLEATIAELEAAVTEQAEDWEPDGSETDTDPTWASAGFPSDQPVEDAEILSETIDPDAEEAARWDAAPAGTIGADQDAAADAPLRLDDPITTPDESPAEDVASALAAHSATEDAIPTEDAAHANVMDDSAIPPLTFRHTADPQDDYGDEMRTVDDHDDSMDAYLRDDAVIDEDALRQLVLEIVREELQGKLGERITRNVRKLVRREIHRVLTSQDFD